MELMVQMSNTWQSLCLNAGRVTDVTGDAGTAAAAPSDSNSSPDREDEGTAAAPVQRASGACQAQLRAQADAWQPSSTSSIQGPSPTRAQAPRGREGRGPPPPQATLLSGLPAPIPTWASLLPGLPPPIPTAAGLQGQGRGQGRSQSQPPRGIMGRAAAPAPVPPLGLPYNERQWMEDNRCGVRAVWRRCHGLCTGCHTPTRRKRQGPTWRGSGPTC
jgi:hypothetical protein